MVVVVVIYILQEGLILFYGYCCFRIICQFIRIFYNGFEVDCVVFCKVDVVFIEQILKRIFFNFLVLNLGLMDFFGIDMLS